MVSVDIIIINYNSFELLLNCVKSVVTNTLLIEYKIYIIDNNSEKFYQHKISNLYDNTCIILNKNNIGFGAANNIGIRQSTSDYILLLNPDTFLQNNAIQVFLNFMEEKENQRVWCCGANILDEKLNPSYAYGKYTSVIKIFFEQFRLNKIFKKYYDNKFLPVSNYLNNCQTKVPFVIGANMFIRRESLDKIGLFDEDFDLYFEEAELSFRAAQKGYYAAVLSEAKIVHYGGKSFKDQEQQWLYYRKNEILFAKKCFSHSKYLLIYFIYLLGTLFRLLINYNNYDLTLLKFLLLKKWRNIL